MTTPFQEREDQLRQLASRSCEHLLRGEFATGEKVAREFLELAQDASDAWHSLAQLRLGTILENAGRYKEALAHAEAAQNLHSPADPSWCNAAGLIGNILLHQGDPNSAKARFLNVLDVWPESSFALCSLSAAEFNLENIDAAKSYALRALQSAGKSDDREHISVAYNLLGDAELDSGNPGQAAKYFRNALAISEEIGRRRGISIACQRLSKFESQRKNYDEALKLGKRAVKAETEMGRTSEIAHVCWRVLEGLRATESPMIFLGAIGLCQIAFEAATDAEDKVWALRSSAWFHRDLKRFRQAEKLLAQALGYVEESDEEHARIHGLLAILKRDQGFPGGAKEAFLHSVELAERHGHKRAQQVGYRWLGDLAKDTGDVFEARRYWQRSLKLAQDAGDTESATHLQETLKFYRPTLLRWLRNKMPW